MDPDLWKAGLTLMGAAAIVVISEPIKWAFNSYIERRALRKDADRWPYHLEKSEKWLDLTAEALERGLVPNVLHLEKIKIPNDAILFSPTYARHLGPRAIDRLHETRLLARNLNLDLQAAIDAIGAGNPNSAVIVRYVKARVIFLAHAMPFSIRGMPIPPCPRSDRPFLLLREGDERLYPPASTALLQRMVPPRDRPGFGVGAA